MKSPDRRLISIASIHARRTRWVWADRIPLRAITILDGDPGSGKSSMTYDVAARVSSGRSMPGCDHADPPAGVVILQAEDNLATTVRPALQSAGANLSRIHVYDPEQFGGQPLTLPADLALIEDAAREVQARLVVIDPLTAFLTGNANNDQSIRHSMGLLAAFAARAELAVLLVRHLRKSGSSNAAYRGAGSIGIIAAARSALMVGPDPATTDPHRRVLAQSKTNLSTATSLAYRTVKSDDQITIDWLGESRCTAQDLACAGGEGHSLFAEAQWVLYSLLSEGPMRACEVVKQAAKAQVSTRTLQRAKQQLQIVTRKHGGGSGSWWEWELPDDKELLRPFRERDRDAFLEPFTFRDPTPFDDDEGPDAMVQSN